MKLFYGYRRIEGASVKNWTSARINRHLIRKDVEFVLSVDPVVWPLEDYDPANAANGFKRSSKNFLEIDQWVDSEVSYDSFKIHHGLYIGEVDHTLRFLGYDVADKSLTSSLSNCGAGPWCTRQYNSINKFSLFDDLREAEEFRNYSDSEVTGHAPFLVFSIFVDNRGVE
jgi:hypothetical protein